MDLQAEKTTIGELLGQNRVQLRVPPYQRPYAWGDDQIDDLWDDLVAAIGSRHFIGSIVLSTDDKQAPQIIDGQQRLTTIAIVLGLVRDRLWALGEMDAAAGIQHDLFFTSHRAKGDERYVLRLGRKNWEVFRDLVLRQPDDADRLDPSQERLSPEERTRNARIIENHRRLSERLDHMLDGLSPGERVRRLNDLEEAIVVGLELVEIRVSQLSDAFLLFETLNDRGLPLSAADLLKNHLLARTSELSGEGSVDSLSGRWDEMIDVLGARVDITRFFRHYLLVRHHPVAMEQVYDRFKKEVAAIGPEPVMTELRKAAGSYGDFEEPKRRATDEPEVTRVLEDLQTLRAARCYVMLLPARRWLSSEDFVTLARRAEVLTYRYSSICGLDAKALELVYHRAAKVLDAKRQDGLAEALALLDASMPNSEDFRSAFNRQRMGVQYLLRYTLARIEEHLAPGRERSLNLSRSQIEHIMPKTLADGWRDELGDGGLAHLDFVHRWGNLTLLHNELNSPASNRTLDGKRPYYRSSEVHLTRLLAEEKVWDYAAIERRQAWLAELADGLWPAAGLPSSSTPFSTVGPVRGLEGLPVDIRERFESMQREVTVEELQGMRTVLDVHVSDIEIAGAADPTVDVSLAVSIRGVLTELIDRANELGSRERSLVAAAVQYFALRDDAADDHGAAGLHDDELVVDAVCRAVGRGHLPVGAGPTRG